MYPKNILFISHFIFNKTKNLVSKPLSYKVEFIPWVITAWAGLLPSFLWMISAMNSSKLNNMNLFLWPNNFIEICECI